MIKLKNRPDKITNKFLSVLPERSCNIIIRRFGLGNDSKKITLEAIGRDYGITRERVRQIESNALKNIRKSEVFNNEKSIFDELYIVIDKLGGVVSEEDVLNYLADNESLQNYIYFLLILSDSFMNEKENTEFKSRWYIDNSLANQVYNSLNKISNEISVDDLYSEENIVTLFIDKVGNIHEKYKNNQDVIKRWLSISKKIGKNHFNEWGLTNSNNINAKGIRDYAYLSIRQNGSPMHFREVAKSIEQNFNRKAHPATCHNSLIKDSRFVLVGRGLYALSEWGYVSGVVKDVIANILEKNGPLTKEEIIDKVLRERYIKENTVVVNLQNSDSFKKDVKGRYILV